MGRPRVQVHVSVQHKPYTEGGDTRQVPHGQSGTSTDRACHNISERPRYPRWPNARCEVISGDTRVRVCYPGVGTVFWGGQCRHRSTPQSHARTHSLGTVAFFLVLSLSTRTSIRTPLALAILPDRRQLHATLRDRVLVGNRTGAGNTAVIGKRVQRVRVRGGETVPECTPYPFTAG